MPCAGERMERRVCSAFVCQVNSAGCGVDLYQLFSQISSTHPLTRGGGGVRYSQLTDRAFAACGKVQRRCWMRWCVAPQMKWFSALLILGVLGVVAAPARAQIPGDVNGDGTVNAADLAGLAACMGGPSSTATPECGAVFPGDRSRGSDSCKPPASRQPRPETQAASTGHLVLQIAAFRDQAVSIADIASSTSSLISTSMVSKPASTARIGLRSVCSRRRMRLPFRFAG